MCISSVQKLVRTLTSSLCQTPIKSRIEVKVTQPQLRFLHIAKEMRPSILIRTEL